MEQVLLSVIVNGRKPHEWSDDPRKNNPHAFKESILKDVGIKNFQKSVGNNPDLGINEDNKIFLKGRGEFKGRIYTTDIDADFYFSALVLSDGWKVVGHSIRPDQKQRARRAWAILTTAAKQERVYTYKELCDQLGFHHRVARWFLNEIQEYCSDHKLPALQALVVSSFTRLPGAGYALPVTRQAHEAELRRVFNHQWSSHPPLDF